MKVYMLKDVENVGMSGQVVTVSDGFASNYLFPRHLATKVDKEAEAFFSSKKQKERISSEVLNSKTAMLAERIKNITISIKEKTHDNGKLYGSIGADQIVELLKAKEVVINRKQVEFTKAIKEVGEYKVTIKLTSKLKPQVTLTVATIPHK